MKCMSCPLKTGTLIYITDEGDQIELYECPFGDHAWHLWDHRCTKLTKRKEVTEALQNGGENYVSNNSD